ncbi:hypothetical protein [Micrococcus sp.]|uniref:hypothetical protein n=1 Tax=Micrococcus sp. TaxID=1271 RepID=UPI002A91A9C1|nr:hypothetical protein [Micrococcus sp.]MDY6055692.1 hypothetical protein [Micrococcus sp.]
MDSPTLQRRLRSDFDARVFNHGDYNVVYGQPSGGSAPLVIGYRHAPLEMVLCPLELSPEPGQTPAPPVSVALDNVATLADTGSGYQVETVTGFRTWFEVTEHAVVPVGAQTEDGTAHLDQSTDAPDFHQFMTAFMDELDRLYAEPTAPIATAEGTAPADG